MRTTLDLDDDLMRSAKQQAVHQGTSLTRVVEYALRGYLDDLKKPAKPFSFVPVVKKGALLPGVDLDDRDALYERMGEARKAGEAGTFR